MLRMRHRLIVLRESKGAKLLLSGDEAEMSEDEEGAELLLSGDEAEMSEDEEVGKAVAKSL